MKICNKCRVEKPFSEFNKKKNGFQPYCRECDKAASKARYAANRDSHIARVRERNVRIISESRDFIIEHLKNNPCVDCGNSDVRVLEFDHLSDKSFNIGTAVGTAWSLDRIKAEVLKCEVRCANCHRIITAERAGTWRSIYSPKV